MAGDNAEPTHAAPDEQANPGAVTRGKRQRAVDLFSPHSYRALQVSAFERRKGRTVPLDTAQQPPRDAADDAADPLLDSDTPAAEAARAHLPGLVPEPPRDMLAPVPMGEAVVHTDDVDLAATVAVDDHVELASAAVSGESTGTTMTAVEAGEYVDPRDWLVEHDGAVEQAEATDASSAPTTSKPGRNMPVATAVGLALLAVAVGAAYVHPLAFAVLLYGFAVGAVIEWKRALERHGRRIPLVPIVAATLGMGVATYYDKPEGLVVALLVGCAGVVAWRIGDERAENTLADSLAGVLTLLWIPFLASFLFLLELADDGWMRVVVIVVAVVGNDTGALIAGVKFGKHKLLPRVSPAKTWEGAIGGVLLGTIAAAVAAAMFFDGDWYIGAAVGFASAVAAVIGDLAESALKRDIQIKDMSSVLPGHGGILDRIDSLLFASPVGYVVFAIFLGTLGGGGL